jgi:hypothetical protein
MDQWRQDWRARPLRMALGLTINGIGGFILVARVFGLGI